MLALAHWWTTPNLISNWRTFLALMERTGPYRSSGPVEYVLQGSVIYLQQSYFKYAGWRKTSSRYVIKYVVVLFLSMTFLEIDGSELTLLTRCLVMVLVTLITSMGDRQEPVVGILSYKYVVQC
jgi:hypothetical protein